MSVNLSGLPDYVRQNSIDFVVKSITKAKTVEFLKQEDCFLVGVKGTEAIPLMDADVVLQENDNCGRTPQGNTSISQAKITVHPLKDEQDFCPKAYEKKYTVEYLTAGQTYSEELFANQFMELRASKIAMANEKLIWQGDTAEVDTNLNKFDGFIKLLPVATTLPVGSTLLERLQKAYLTVDQSVKNQEDFAIFISENDLDTLNIELANKNIYKETDNQKLFGTSARLVALPGLNGKDFIGMGRSRTLRIATDLMNEAESAEMYYSHEKKLIYQDFHFALGVAVVYADEFKTFKKA